ncbi:MAG: hypothetical protein ACYCZS_03645 [Thiobacillus sp.]
MRQRDLDRYAELMAEVRRRLEAINDFLGGRTRTTYVRTTTESICLQLRKILELIAFASLVSNRKAYASLRQDIARDWHADRILKKIEKVNSDFYPKPVRSVLLSSALAPSQFVPVRSGALTRKQFSALYDKCGELLHATNPFTAQKNFEAFEKQIPTHVRRIETLLGEHTVSLAGTGQLLWVLVPNKKNELVGVWHLVKKRGDT